MENVFLKLCIKDETAVGANSSEKNLLAIKGMKNPNYTGNINNSDQIEKVNISNI